MTRHTMSISLHSKRKAWKLNSLNKSEVYVKDKWILIDSTSGMYIENYDPSNPVINIAHSVEAKGHFALLKGLDPEGYGINSERQLHEHLKEFARKVKSIEMHYPKYIIKDLRLAGS